MRDIRIIWIMVKPGEARFYTFTRMPGKEWLDVQRANGYILFKAAADLPGEFDLPVNQGALLGLRRDDEGAAPVGWGNAEPTPVDPAEAGTSRSCYDPWPKVWVIPEPDPTSTQVGGDHYRHYPIQPIDFIQANEIPFVEGCVIEYMCRWQDKGGLEDLEKARHFLALKIAYEKNKINPTPSTKG